MGDDGIRRAASVITARDGAGGPDVLVVERSEGSRFLPGYVVFPGGATDEGDEVLARRWFGSSEQAARACAVRELVEEAGLAITADGVVEAGTPDSLQPVHARPPVLDQLPEVAHWVAPEEVPVRFDARYFAVAASPGLNPSPDGAEAAHAWWASPRDLLADWEFERRKMYWPTYLTMTELARCGSVRELLALRMRTREPDDRELEFLHRSTFWQD